MLYILPTTVFEALQCQKRDIIRKETAARKRTMTVDQLEKYIVDVDSACQAIVHLSNACRITQQYSVSEADIVKLRASLAKWQEFLTNNFYPNVFTINMHYLTHVGDAITALGPLRLVSARPMERMIGQVKSTIKSRKDPAANANTCVIKHFAGVYKDKYVSNTLSADKVIYGKTETIDVCVSLIKKRDDCFEEGDIKMKFQRQAITLVESYFPIRTGKKLTLATQKSTSVIFASADSNIEQYIPQAPGLKYGKVLLLYNDGGDDRALIKLIYPIS